MVVRNATIAGEMLIFDVGVWLNSMEVIDMKTVECVVVLLLSAVVVCFSFATIRHTKQNFKSNIQYATAKSVVVTDLVSIEELQKAINENKEMFADDGVIVGPNFVVLVNEDTLSLQVIQSPVKQITSSEKINPTPNPKQTDDNAGNIGAPVK